MPLYRVQEGSLNEYKNEVNYMLHSSVVNPFYALKVYLKVHGQYVSDPRGGSSIFSLKT